MEDTTAAKEILYRLRQGTGATTDGELGRVIGVSPQAVYNARNSNKLPDTWVKRAADQFNLSTDWLYFGVGHMYRGEVVKNDVLPNSIDRDVLLDVVETLENFLIGARKTLPPGAKAELIYQLYQMVLEEEADAKKQPLRAIKLIQDAISEDE